MTDDSSWRMASAADNGGGGSGGRRGGGGRSGPSIIAGRRPARPRADGAAEGDRAKAADAKPADAKPADAKPAESMAADAKAEPKADAKQQPAKAEPKQEQKTARSSGRASGDAKDADTPDADEERRSRRRRRPASRAKDGDQGPEEAPSVAEAVAEEYQAEAAAESVRAATSDNGDAPEAAALAPAPASPRTSPRTAPQQPDARPNVENAPAALVGEIGELRALVERQSRELSAMRDAIGGLTDQSRKSARRARIGLFIDVPNLMYGIEADEQPIHMGKLLDFLTEGRELVRATAYSPVSDDPSEPVERQKFVAPFVPYEYRIVTKPLKRFADGSIKGNFDVEMAIDMITMADRLDIICVVSGDADFARAVEVVQQRGVRVEVASFARSTSIEMRALADSFLELGRHLDKIR